MPSSYWILANPATAPPFTDKAAVCVPWRVMRAGGRWAATTSQIDRQQDTAQQESAERDEDMADRSEPGDPRRQMPSRNGNTNIAHILSFAPSCGGTVAEHHSHRRV
jgi:hypothetical protein